MPDSTKRTPHTILPEIVANTRNEVNQRQTTHPLESWISQVEPLTGFPFEAALHTDKPIHLITEIKPSSPSAGVLQEKPDFNGILEAYNQYASAISVLTDSKYFGGSLERLTEVATQSPHPVLCKDFILDPYQVYEARRAKAAAVLLIVKILDDATLHTLHDLTRRLGMTPVVEIQNEAELRRALSIGATVLLINNRDLSSFEISLKTTQHLVQQLAALALPADQAPLIISASGIETRADIDTLLPFARCFLIGSSLMRLPVQALPAKLAELSAAAIPQAGKA